jgi:hypothetical protein
VSEFGRRIPLLCPSITPHSQNKIDLSFVTVLAVNQSYSSLLLDGDPSNIRRGSSRSCTLNLTLDFVTLSTEGEVRRRIKKATLMADLEYLISVVDHFRAGVYTCAAEVPSSSTTSFSQVKRRSD